MLVSASSVGNYCFNELNNPGRVAPEECNYDYSDNWFNIVTPSTCTDSDGYNIYTKGTVTVIDNGQTYTDSCLSNNTVKEYVCKLGVVESSSGVDCPNNYTCQDGACKSTIPRPSITLLSPNGGERFTVGSSMTIKWQNFNYRSSVINITLYRSNRIPGNLDYNYVAQIGKLAQSNDGIETWVIPSTIPPGDNYFVQVALDVQDPQAGFDMTDDSNAPFSIIAPTTSFCTDSDGGDNPYVKGTVAKGNTIITDSCNRWVFNGQNYQYNLVSSCNGGADCFVNEAICNSQYTYNDVEGLGQKLINCPSGYTCQDGACKASTPPATIKQCSAFFVSGVLNIGGAYSNLPIGQDGLTKAQCREAVQTRKESIRYEICSNIALTDSENIIIKWGDEIIDQFSAQCSAFVMHASCIQGICARTPGVGTNQCSSNNDCVQSCTDSDGGNNYYVKGRTVSQKGDYTDTCESSSILREYYCGIKGDYGLVQSTAYTCPSGYTCQDGACKVTAKPAVSSCSWCGVSCQRIYSWMYCPQIAPPAGYDCREINGTCQKVATGRIFMLNTLQTKLAQIQDIITKLTASIVNLNLAH